MDNSDQQSIRSSSSFNLIDPSGDDEELVQMQDSQQQELHEISADKDFYQLCYSSHEQKTTAVPYHQRSSPAEQQHQQEVQCQQQQQMGSLSLEEQPQQNRRLQSSSATVFNDPSAEVDHDRHRPLNVVALVEVQRTDIPEFRHTFKYEFNNTKDGWPTVGQMLDTLLPDNLHGFESMEELLEQYELLQVQQRDRKMEEADWNNAGGGTAPTKFYVDLGKKQQREQKVQHRDEYRVVLRPKSTSVTIGSNPQQAIEQAMRPSIPLCNDYTMNEPQLGMVPVDQKVIKQQHSNRQMEHRPSIHRYMLSNGIHLGQLYNAHTDNLMYGQNSSFDLTAGNCRRSARLEKLTVVENLANVEQRLQMFDIEQKISIASKFAELGEHNVLGNFLRHAETIGNNASNSFGIVYTSPTKTFTLRPDAEQLLLLGRQEQSMSSLMDLDMGSSTDATHAVRAITYGFMVGAIFTVLAQHPKQKPLEAKDVQRLVLMRLQNRPMSSSESSLFGTLDTAKVVVTVFSNNNGSNDCSRGKQMSLASALELFEAATRKAKNAIINSNDDNGHPISCELMPVTTFVGGIPYSHKQQQHAQREAAAAILFDRIKTHVELLEEVERDNAILQVYVDEFAHCLREMEWQRAKQLGAQFDRLKATFCTILQDAVLQLRAHAYHGGNMALLGEERLGLDTIQQLHQQLRNFMDANAKNRAIALCWHLKQKGVRYIGRGNTTLEAELTNKTTSAAAADVGGHHRVPGSSRSTIVLFWDHEQAEPNQVDQDSLMNAHECLALFDQLISARGPTNCMLVDLSLAAVPPAVVDMVDNPCSTRLVKFVGTTPIVTDYLQEEIRKRTMCVARRTSADQQDDIVVALVDSSDNKLLDLVVMPCPNAKLFSAATNNGGTKSCPNDERSWECDECGQFMQMDKSDLSGNNRELWFHCTCGRVPVTALRFRCPGCVALDFRGQPFADHALDALRSRLSANLGRKNKNILILGETGVGKSTWINALANYMTYGSMTDAIDSDGPPNCLIPAEFTITDEELRPRVVRMGGGLAQAQRDNERHVRGKSCTQGPHTYVFKYLGGELRLIDTAGIGDTDGIEQDKRNFDKLLNYLSNIGELHGICILLHPNKARLSVAFRYCIGELFSHLHRNAAQNIVFCFTNSRSTLYKPGDSLQPLQAFLDQLAKDRGVKIELNPRTVYCMDNESFRFLCAVKDGVQFSADDFANFEESWRRTESETKRMLAYLDQLKPHRTEETTTLNEARRFIFLMAKPLAQVTNTIQSNISLMNNEKNRLASLDASVVDFKAQLMIQKVCIEHKELPYPRTVCIADEHTEVYRDEEGKTRVLYKQHCHPHCYLNNVTLLTHPEPALQGCWAMSHRGGQVVCHVCGCQWDMHMHINYEQYEVNKMVEDQEVQRQLQSTNNKREQQQILINNAQERIRQYTEEQSRINTIAAKFASFLQHNAIMTYNDAVREYLQVLIREAKRIAEHTQNPEDSRKVAALEDFLAEYMEQRKMLEQSLSTGATTIEPRDIKRYFEELMNLPLTGEDIRKLYELEEKGQNRQMNYMESACPTKERRMRGQQRPQKGNAIARNRNYLPFRSSASSSSSIYHHHSSGPSLSSLLSSWALTPLNKFSDVLQGFNHRRNH